MVSYFVAVGSFSGSAVYIPSTLVPFRITSALISIALKDAAESVVKKGLPVPAPIGLYIRVVTVRGHRTRVNLVQLYQPEHEHRWGEVEKGAFEPKQRKTDMATQ